MSSPSAGAITSARHVAIGRTLDDEPVTKRRRYVWFLASAGIGLDGYDLFIMSAAGPLIVADLGLDTWQKSIAVGAAVLGAVPGALLGGRLADRIGRQRMLKIDLFVFVVTAVLSAFAWNVASLAVFRFLQGAAVGAEYPLSASMVSEVMPARSRGRWMTGAFSFQAVGMVAASAVATALLLAFPHAGTWRLMLLSGVIPAVVVAVLRLRVPESPRWTARMGRLDEAEGDVEWMTGVRPSPSAHDFSHAEIHQLNPTNPPAGMRELWSPSLRRATLLSTVPWFLMDIALYGVGLFTPTIIAGLLGGPSSSSNTNFLADDITSTASAAFTDLFLIVGFALNIVLVERAGRIRLQMIGFAGMAVGLGILAAVGNDGAFGVIVLGFIMFNTMINLGPNATTYLLPTEVYPTRIRGTGHGFAAASGKVGAVVGTFLLPFASSSFGLGPTLAVIAVLSVVGLVATGAFSIETRGVALAEA